MKSIWKFPLALQDEQMISMPEGAKPLSAQVQGGVLCLWALVDMLAPVAPRKVLVKGTGHPCDDSLDASQHVGTFQVAGGALIFHVFVL